jgi:hypothetical protein
MFDQLQSLVPLFEIRLSETIAWCMAQALESDPVESLEIQQRRRLGEQAAKLSHRARASNGPWFWKPYLRRRANRLWKRANISEIAPPLEHQLRSPCLKPAPFVYPQSVEERAGIVETLAEKRAEQLRLKRRYPNEPRTSLQGGRLLLYAPDENLCDGAAQYSSKGFFDVDNAPPWDAWVCSFRSYLVSWVPPELLELAKAGIEANPEQCIFWAPEAGLPNA